MNCAADTQFLFTNFNFYFQWFTWGPPNLNCRVCSGCWSYWKRYGGLKAGSQVNEADLSSTKKRAASSDIDEEQLTSLLGHRPNR